MSLQLWMLLICYAEVSLLFFLILNTSDVLVPPCVSLKHFVIVEIRSIHIWSLTTIYTFSLLSNQLPWIVTFFAPPPKTVFQFWCITSVLAVLYQLVWLLSLIFLQYVWTLCTIFWQATTSFCHHQMAIWIGTESSWPKHFTNKDRIALQTSLRDQVFRLLTLHINWLAELYHICTTNFLSDKVFSVFTTGHLRVGWWLTLVLFVAYFWY